MNRQINGLFVIITLGCSVPSSRISDCHHLPPHPCGYSKLEGGGGGGGEGYKISFEPGTKDGTGAPHRKVV